jgi:hypothetical protein
MFKKESQSALFKSTPESLGKSFRRLGWIGFWIQLVLACFSIILAVYVLFFSTSASIQQRGLGFSEYMVLIGLLILLFTIFWFYRYTIIGRKLADPDKRPSQSSVVKTLWVGLWASCLGIAFSMVLMIVEVSRLLLLFLRAPQGGVPVIQTDTYDPSTWVSAIDMVGLLGDLSILAAELVVLAFTLWLLLRVSFAKGFDTAKTT